MKTKKRILSVLLSMSMVIPTIILPQSVMAEDVVTEDTTVETDDENTVISYNFDDGVVPAGFSYKKTEGYDPTITAANGRMQYKTKSSKGSGLLFDLSSLVSLAEQRCEKLIFEYDYYPEVLEYTSTRYLYTRIVDNNGKFYNLICNNNRAFIC